MSNLPPGWQLASLDELCEWRSGGTPRRSEPSYFGGDYPWITISDLNDGGVDSTAEFLSASGIANSSAKLIPEGTVLVALYGSIGKLGITKQPATTNQAIACALPDETAFDPLYLFHFLRSRRRELGLLGTGVTQKNIYLGDIKAFVAPIAPRAEQTRIVAKLEELLSDLDAGVAELKAAQKKLAQYRQSLLKAAVEGALTADWRTRNPPTETGAELLQRILTERRARWEAKQLAKFKEQGKAPPKDWQKKYPEPVQPDTAGLPELPEGWVWASVDQLSTVVRGASPRPAGDPRFFGGDIPWITVGSLTADASMYLNSVSQFVTEAGRDASRHVDPGTLLLTNSGATLGVPKITKIGGCINDGSVALLDVDDVLKIYLYWYLRTQTMILRATNQGAAQPNLNTDIVKRICVPVCPRIEMSRINDSLDAQIDAIDAQRQSIAVNLNQSTAQRQNILRAAFAGQLVPQDPNDEPASVLLERIRAGRAAAAGRGSKASEKKPQRKAVP